jgi:hypothetical protein
LTQIASHALAQQAPSLAQTHASTTGSTQPGVDAALQQSFVLPVASQPASTAPPLPPTP